MMNRFAITFTLANDRVSLLSILNLLSCRIDKHDANQICRGFVLHWLRGDRPMRVLAKSLAKLSVAR
jgi:hypothetical protein